MRLCAIPSRTLGPCDLEWGHAGEMHVSEGDGFYARDHEAEHKKRQEKRLRRAGRMKLREVWVGLCTGCGELTGVVRDREGLDDPCCTMCTTLAPIVVRRYQLARARRR